MPNIYVQNMISAKIFEVKVSLVDIKIQRDIIYQKNINLYSLVEKYSFLYYIWCAELKNNVFTAMCKQPGLKRKSMKTYFL